MWSVVAVAEVTIWDLRVKPLQNSYVVKIPHLPVNCREYFMDERRKDQRQRRRYRDDVQFVCVLPMGLPPLQQLPVVNEDDERVEGYANPDACVSIRNQRFQSLAAMSRLRNQKRQAVRLLQRATAFLDEFLRDELQSCLVPDCLLEIPKDMHNEELQAAKERDDVVTTTTEWLYTTFMSEVVDDCIRSVFQEYMLTRVDLTRAAMSPTLVIANDLLEDWQRELFLREVVPEVLEELVMDYFQQKRVDDTWCDELYEMLHVIAQDAITECFWETSILHEELQVIAADAIVEQALDQVITTIVRKNGSS
ncbi:hypothetical protein FI667_g10873, partial [Globisporangium splendens]